MSFKRKLVLYFVVLTLLPLAAAFITFQPALERSEEHILDERLKTALRSSAVGYQDELRAAEQRALRLAGSSAFQRALAARDRAALERMLEGSSALRVEAGTLTVGAGPAGPAVRRVSVVAPGRRSRVLGVLVATVHLDDGLTQRLLRRSGLESGDSIVVLRNGRVAAGPRALKGIRLHVGRGQASTVRTPLGAFRVLAVEGPPALAALAPRASIDPAVDSGRRRLLGAFALSLLLVGIVAYLEGRSIVRVVSELVAAARAIAGGRPMRRVVVRGRDELAELARAFNEMTTQLDARRAEVEAERRRAREATLRFGQALSATHDVDLLRMTIVETAVEATAATGGAFVVDGTEVARWGALEGADTVELPVNAGHGAFGTLVLYGPGFELEAVETASLLVGHAAVALENARLHRIVERQALADGMTGLANRRRAEEALAAELARSDRFGSPVAVVLADLDDFKAVNDGHGHESGDAVLRAFADVMRESVREVDLVARWGGEEFLLLLPGTTADGACLVAERARAAMAGLQVRTTTGAAVTVTASFGVGSHTHGGSREDVLTAADGALYEAKRLGKNRVVGAAAARAVQSAD